MLCVRTQSGIAYLVKAWPAHAAVATCLGKSTMADHAAPQHDGPDASAVRSSLERVLNHPQFVAAPRLASFLKFIVETTLEGNGRLIKAYTVATMALDRPDSFDPAADAIVRVEANRLRNALARYYACEGSEDAIIIELPRGCYVPSFCFRDASGPATAHWLSDGSVPPVTEADLATARADRGLSHDERMLEVMIDEYRHWISELMSSLTQIRDELMNARTAAAVSNTLIRLKDDARVREFQNLALEPGNRICTCGRNDCDVKISAVPGDLGGGQRPADFPSAPALEP